MEVYRLILYRHFQNKWHYTRLTAPVDGMMQVETGICGKAADSSELVSTGGKSQIEAITHYSEQLQEKGWGNLKNVSQELSVLTLHFKMPRWKGYPAGAPWFDNWMQYYMTPIRAELEAHSNGFELHDERFSGNYLYYFTVLNPDLALEAVEKIADKSPEKFILDLHVGKRGKQVFIPIDPNVPEYLQAFFRVVEKSARSIANELPLLFPGKSLEPELVQESDTTIPVHGEKGIEFRRILREKWNFTCNYWNPLSNDAPGEVVFILGFPPDKQQQLIAHIRKNQSGPIYKLDCENGLFQVPLDSIFQDTTLEGVIFDERLDWIIYASHHNTHTFGGELLLSFVKNQYKDQPEAINFW
jgi:hypothetical protein